MSAINPDICAVPDSSSDLNLPNCITSILGGGGQGGGGADSLLTQRIGIWRGAPWTRRSAQSANSPRTTSQHKSMPHVRGKAITNTLPKTALSQPRASLELRQGAAALLLTQGPNGNAVGRHSICGRSVALCQSGSNLGSISYADLFAI